MTNKDKKKLKKFITIIITVATLIVAGVSWLLLTLTTPPSLQDVIEGLNINPNEISMEVSIANNESQLNFVFIISEKNNYIKTVKTENNIEETTILYNQNDLYYLYKKDTSEINFQLLENDAKNMFLSLQNDVIYLNDLLEVNYDSIKYYSYNENQVTYSNYRNNIFYDNIIDIKDDKLVEFTQTYTKNNQINTIKVNIIEEIKIELPNIN